MDKELTTASIIIGIVWLLVITLKRHQNKKTCLHINKTDVTVESNVTCETIHTICDDCGKVLNVRVDC